jgi:ABC-type glycerol-3-phosphate transport system permease component
VADVRIRYGYVLAGIRGIPQELSEAAQVDGASNGKYIDYIILPLLQPITLGSGYYSQPYISQDI